MVGRVRVRTAARVVAYSPKTKLLRTGLMTAQAAASINKENMRNLRGTLMMSSCSPERNPQMNP